MADILARLKEAINGKAPQHKVEGKTEFEFTEGKDGKLNVRDVDVKAELELIKQQQQQILDRLNQPVKTELTGSTVEEVIFPRQIRNSDSPLITRDRPKNAVGLFVEHIVYGRTGRFESGKGHSITAMPYNLTPGRALVGGLKDFTTERSSQYTSNDHSFSISLLPYKSLENKTNVSIVVPPIYKRVRFQILISGSFDNGEGVDSELIAHWILK